MFHSGILRGRVQDMRRNVLRALRRRAGISQDGLAKICGVHRRTVMRWEMGTVEIKQHVYEYCLMRLWELVDRKEKGKRMKK